MTSPIPTRASATVIQDSASMRAHFYDLQESFVVTKNEREFFNQFGSTIQSWFANWPLGSSLSVYDIWALETSRRISLVSGELRNTIYSDFANFTMRSYNSMVLLDPQNTQLSTLVKFDDRAVWSPAVCLQLLTPIQTRINDDIARITSRSRLSAGIKKVAIDRCKDVSEMLGLASTWLSNSRWITALVVHNFNHFHSRLPQLELLNHCAEPSKNTAAMARYLELISGWLDQFYDARFTGNPCLTFSELRAKLSATIALLPQTPTAKSLAALRVDVSHLMRELQKAQMYWIVAMAQNPQPCYYPATTLQLAVAVVADIYLLTERLGKKHFSQEWKSSTQALYAFLETGTSLIRLDRKSQLFRLSQKDVDLASQAAELVEAHAKLVHETVLDCLEPILSSQALCKSFRACLQFTSPQALLNEEKTSRPREPLERPTKADQTPPPETCRASNQKQQDGLSVYRMLFSDIFAINKELAPLLEACLQNFDKRIPELQIHLTETARAIGALDYPIDTSANGSLHETCILALGALYRGHQVSAFPLLFAEQLVEATGFLVHAPHSDAEFCLSDTLLHYLDIDAALIAVARSLDKRQEPQPSQASPVIPTAVPKEQPDPINMPSMHPVAASKPDPEREITLRHHKTRHILALMHDYGFTETRQKGSHKIFQHIATGGQVVVPDHPSLPIGTVKSIEEQVRAALISDGDKA